MNLSRRAALRGLFMAAPAIVAAPSLMRVSTALMETQDTFWHGPFRPRPFTAEELRRAMDSMLKYYQRPQLIMVGSEFMHELHIIAPESIGYRPIDRA